MVTAIRDANKHLADVAAELRQAVGGDVRFDRTSRLLYATDASIYQIIPHGVVVPRDLDDIAATVEVATRHDLPILPRGGGTSQAGQAVGAAIVVDCSRHLNQLLEVNPETHTCRVQPGLVVAQLNRLVAPYGLMFGPDPSSAERATIGGSIGNNAAGAHSILYGMTADNVVGIKALLADGAWCTFEPRDPAAAAAAARHDGRGGQLYRAMLDHAARYREQIESDFPRHWRRASGYNLDRLLRDVRGGCLNLAELLVGSEGTLAFIGEATLKLVPRPRRTGLAVLEFDDLIQSLEATMPLLETEPAAVELLDKAVLDLTRQQPEYARALTWVQGDPEAMLLVEFFGENEAELCAKLDRLETCIRRWGYTGPLLKLVDPEDQARVWRIRKAGQGLLMSIKGDWKPIPFVEDTAVRPDQLPAFIRQFRDIVHAHGTKTTFYAHASAGCLHCRPLVNLKTAEGVKTLRSIAEQIVDLAAEFGGTMSGEHGDGLARSEFNQRIFGPDLYRAMQELKAAWDPDNRFNPGKVVNAPPMDQNLRYGPDYHPREPATILSFAEMQGFARAIEQCSGVGICRHTHSGVMCPSFRATREEADSTRGRANILRAAISGHLPGGLASSKVYDVLDLCLECKACKTECPTQVDMAKLKYEFLYHYYQVHRRPLRDYLFAHIHEFYRWGAPLGPAINRLMRLPLHRAVQARVGIAPERRLPALHRKTFRHWFERHAPHPNAGRLGEVVLFADTFTTYNYPEVGIAATNVLESCGWSVRLTPNVCCGRPLISKGFLPQARQRAEEALQALAPLVRAGVPIIGLEPSCLLTFRDEVPDFLPGHPDVEALRSHSFLLGEFLSQQITTFEPPFEPRHRTVLFHGHCHEKSAIGAEPSLAALRLVPGQTVRLIQSTCCGMAGSFGFEAEHDTISRQIAHLSLVRAVQAAPDDAVIATSGVSCRQQITHLTDRAPRHIAEVLADALSETRGDHIEKVADHERV